VTTRSAAKDWVANAMAPASASTENIPFFISHLPLLAAVMSTLMLYILTMMHVFVPSQTWLLHLCKAALPSIVDIVAMPGGADR
jgi:hypothetical protein